MSVQYDVGVVSLDSSDSLLTGPAKLAQRVLLELLTEKGSLLYLPERGTTFARALRSQLFSTEREVLVQFSASLLDLQRNLQGEESDSDPDDERFDTASLDGLTLLPGQLSFTLTVVSRDPLSSLSALVFSIRY